MERVVLHDFHPPVSDIAEEALIGLSTAPKTLPSKFFYNERGSQLFEKITQLDEYYPTRVEKDIMESTIAEISEMIGPRAMIIEYGSGASVKTRILLDHLDNPSIYVPIDISREHLMESAAKIAADYPSLAVHPVCADYEQPFTLPLTDRPVESRCAFFPGGTVGNLHPPDAVDFLRRIAKLVGDGSLLIGVDLKKDPSILHAAYNDREGVTAEFNLNILERLNEEIHTDFDTERFRHRAIYNEKEGRIEMHLVSTTRQSEEIAGEEVLFDEGETIWTESSYKYTVPEFQALAREAGFDLERVWTDDESLFSVQFYTTFS